MKFNPFHVTSPPANGCSEARGGVNGWAYFGSTALLAFTLSGCAITPIESTGYPEGPSVVYVQTPPPAPLHEMVGPAPGPGFVWVSGYWFWSGAQYVWASGHWLAMRPEHAWVQPAWQRSSRGWWLQGGGWQPRHAPAPQRGLDDPYRPQPVPPQPWGRSEHDRQPVPSREGGRRFMPMPVPTQPPASALPFPSPRAVSPEFLPNRPSQRGERPAPQQQQPDRDPAAQGGDGPGKPMPGWPGWKRNRGQEAQ